MNRARRWPIAHILFSDHGFFLAGVWLVAMLITAAVTVGVGLFGTVTSSMVDGTGSILRWFALGYGTHLTYAMLPTFVAHGRTRREFFGQCSLFIGVGSVGVAALMTLAYLAENLVYNGLGWTHGVSGDRPFATGDNYPSILVSYAVLFAVWTSVGAFIGAAFYRGTGPGVLSIVLGFGVVSLAGTALGFDRIPFLFLSKLDDNPARDLGLPVTVAVCAGAYLVATAANWLTVRTLPLRTRT